MRFGVTSLFLVIGAFLLASCGVDCSGMNAQTNPSCPAYSGAYGGASQGYGYSTQGTNQYSPNGSYGYSSPQQSPSYGNGYQNQYGYNQPGY